MMNNTYKLIWKALADSTRRSIMDAVMDAPQTTGDLALRFPEITRYAVMKHLKILERAQLISVRREGKFRWNHLNAIPIQEIYERWVKKYEAKWAGSMIQLKNYAENKNKIMEDTMQLSSTVVSMTTTINASKEVVWKALLHETGLWWRKDFYTSANTKNFIIQPKIGGLMYEDTGNGEGLVWAEVVGIDSPNTLQLKGNLAPEFGGPAISFLRIDLEESKEGTILKLTDSIFGKIGAGLQKDMTEGWKLLFGDGLKNYVERK